MKEEKHFENQADRSDHSIDATVCAAVSTEYEIIIIRMLVCLRHTLMARVGCTSDQ